MQYPKLPIIWLYIEYPHTGLTGSWLIHGRHASQRMGLVVLLALSYTVAKKLAQKSKEPSSADAGLYIVTAISFRPLHSEPANSSNTSYRCYQSHSKAYDWHADSSHRSFVERSRDRITPRILSRTSLKYYIHFSFILKLITFICKQLKRPVAFSVVHCC